MTSVDVTGTGYSIDEAWAEVRGRLRQRGICRFTWKVRSCLKKPKAPDRCRIVQTGKPSKRKDWHLGYFVMKDDEVLATIRNVRTEREVMKRLAKDHRTPLQLVHAMLLKDPDQDLNVAQLEPVGGKPGKWLFKVEYDEIIES